jgi:hypothetical protein
MDAHNPYYYIFVVGYDKWCSNMKCLICHYQYCNCANGTNTVNYGHTLACPLYDTAFTKRIIAIDSLILYDSPRKKKYYPEILKNDINKLF